MIIEPVIDSIDFFKDEMNNYILSIKPEQNLSISIISLVVTSKAKSELNRLIRKSSNVSINFIIYKTLDDNEILPYIDSNQIFEGIEETNNSFGAMRSFFPSLKKDTMLLLFESYCPSRSIPILWKKSSEFTPLFHNGFSINNENDINENNRLRAYKINTELSQKMNKYIVDNLKGKSKNGNWLNVNLIPAKVIKKVNERCVDEGQKYSEESYLDFIDYKEIIKKHQDLQKIFSIKGENLNWLDKLNKLRRDPAHPEKPAPKIKDVEYFEDIANKIIRKMV